MMRRGMPLMFGRTRKEMVVGSRTQLADQRGFSGHRCCERLVGRESLVRESFVPKVQLRDGMRVEDNVRQDSWL